MARRPKNMHPWAWAVISGKEECGELARLACERSYKDHTIKHPDGRRFDTEAADHVLEFFPTYLRHSKGRWAGDPFVLEPWQEFTLWEVFGWYRKNGRRRFREAYLEVARKNGKTTFLAGIGIYMLSGDGEPGSEVYTAATKKDQARIMHSEAVRMVRKSPELSKSLQTFRNNISDPSNESKYEPLGADSKTMDGLNVHCALIDELHAHPDGSLYNILSTGTGARTSPLVIAITTAGDDEQSFCHAQRDYLEALLRGHIEDETFFGLVFSLDEGDDWRNPDTWGKANPNLGVTIDKVELGEAISQAEQSIQKQNSTRRRRLNQWTRSTTRYLDLAAWDKCAGTLMPKQLETAHPNGICYGGLDLSSTEDVTAFVAVFPPPDDLGYWDVVCRFWLPEWELEERCRRTRVPWDQWSNEGWLALTEGRTVDYRQVRNDIAKLLEPWSPAEIGFDPWNASETSKKLGEDHGFEMVKVPQTFPHLSAPTKLLEKLVLSEKLRHGGNPMLRWMADNLEVREQEGAVRPVKPGSKMSHKKIDGMVALIIALNRAGAAVEPPGPSVYARRGVRSL
jgi:phage terminase large subunit-like protein